MKNPTLCGLQQFCSRYTCRDTHAADALFLEGCLERRSRTPTAFTSHAPAARWGAFSSSGSARPSRTTASCAGAQWPGARTSSQRWRAGWRSKIVGRRDRAETVMPDKFLPFPHPPRTYSTSLAGAGRRTCSTRRESAKYRSDMLPQQDDKCVTHAAGTTSSSALLRSARS